MPDPFSEARRAQCHAMIEALPLVQGSLIRRGLVSNFSQAEEMFGEAVLIYAGLSDVDAASIGNIAAWVMRVAANRALDGKRREGSWRRYCSVVGERQRSPAVVAAEELGCVDPISFEPAEVSAIGSDGFCQAIAEGQTRILDAMLHSLPFEMWWITFEFRFRRETLASLASRVGSSPATLCRFANAASQTLRAVWGAAASGHRDLSGLAARTLAGGQGFDSRLLESIRGLAPQYAGIYDAPEPGYFYSLATAAGRRRAG